MRHEDNIIYRYQSCFLNLKENEYDLPIFRIMPIKYLLDIFKTQTLTLSKTSNWNDPFENILSKSPLYDENDQPYHFNETRDNIVAQCWNYENEELDWIWKYYYKNMLQVRIKTTINKLFHTWYDKNDELALIKYFIGKVNYYKQEEIENILNKFKFRKIFEDKSVHNIIATLLTKRKQYYFEKEIRLIFWNRVNIVSDIFKIKIKNSDFIDELLLDPKLTKKSFDCLSNMLRNLGYNKAILKSTLYKPFNFKLKW